VIELCQYIVGSGILRHRPSSRYVAMETTQLVLSQFKNHKPVELGIE